MTEKQFAHELRCVTTRKNVLANEIARGLLHLTVKVNNLSLTSEEENIYITEYTEMVEKSEYHDLLSIIFSFYISSDNTFAHYKAQRLLKKLIEYRLIRPVFY